MQRRYITVDVFTDRAFGGRIALAVDHHDLAGGAVDKGFGAHQIAQPEAGAEDFRQ